MFCLVSPADDILRDCQVVKNVKLLTVLLNHYAKATAQLQSNFGVDCIWDCRFKPHIAKELVLNRLREEGENAMSMELYEG